MSNFPKATRFRSIRLEALKTNAISGVAVTIGIGGDQFAIVGPDRDVALRQAVWSGGNGITPEGAQEVVLMDAAQFSELLKLAGIGVQA